MLDLPVKISHAIFIEVPEPSQKRLRSTSSPTIILAGGNFLNAKNFCIHRFHCRKSNICGKIILCGIKCTSSHSCNQHCAGFVKEQDYRLIWAPYASNGCNKGRVHCTMPNQCHYDGRFTDRKYREQLSSSHSG